MEKVHTKLIIILSAFVRADSILVSFATGCMIYVVSEEMIPEMVSEGHDHFGV